MSALAKLGLVPPGYGRREARSDLLAGLTTAVMLIPQAMAYALLAGLPPIVGLYASAVPLLAYAALGTSRELAVGPVAMDSLLTAATVGAFAESGSDRYLELATLLALMVGALQLALGALRGGFLVNFLSRPVISGFTSAAALIIAASQVRTLLGVDLPRSPSLLETFGSLARRVGEVHLLTLGLSALSIAVLVALKRIAPRVPRALAVVFLGGLVAAFADLESRGLAVVGDVPAGLPRSRLPVTDVETLRALLPGALAIAMVSFMEAISVSSKLATRTGHRVDANREFLALGAANTAAGIFGGYPVAGGLSRSAVNADAGAQSKIAGIVTGLVVLLTLAFFTRALYWIPKASLGAIIVMAVMGLLDLREPRRLWTVKRSDLALLAATFVATLTLGIQQGILIGVGLSLSALVIRTTRPHVAVLGRLPGTEVYRNVLRFPEVERTPGVLILRVDAPFYFGNVNFLRDTLAQLEAQSDVPLRAVILDASGINQIDSSGEATLRELRKEYGSRDIALVIAAAKGPVRDVLARSGFTEEVGPEGFAYRVHDAMNRLARST